MGIKFPVNFSANAQNPNRAWGLARAPIQKQKNSLLNSLLIPKNRENPPSPNELLSKGARVADIKASAKASDKTAVCIVLKQRSNSGNYGQVLYLGKRMAEEQGFEPWEDFHPRRFSRPVHSTTLPLLRQQRVNRQKLIQQGV